MAKIDFRIDDAGIVWVYLANLRVGYINKQGKPAHWVVYLHDGQNRLPTFDTLEKAKKYAEGHIVALILANKGR